MLARSPPRGDDPNADAAAQVARLAPAPALRPAGALPYPLPMHPADLTAPEIADLLAQAYAHDLGGEPGPGPQERAALADYLGCHEEVSAEVRTLMLEQVADREHAEYWLDVEFVEPCPEG